MITNRYIDRHIIETLPDGWWYGFSQSIITDGIHEIQAFIIVKENKAEQREEQVSFVLAIHNTWVNYAFDTLDECLEFIKKGDVNV